MLGYVVNEGLKHNNHAIGAVDRDVSNRRFQDHIIESGLQPPSSNYKHSLSFFGDAPPTSEFMISLKLIEFCAGDAQLSHGFTNAWESSKCKKSM